MPETKPASDEQITEWASIDGEGVPYETWNEWTDALIARIKQDRWKIESWLAEEKDWKETEATLRARIEQEKERAEWGAWNQERIEKLKAMSEREMYAETVGAFNAENAKLREAIAFVLSGYAFHTTDDGEVRYRHVEKGGAFFPMPESLCRLRAALADKGGDDD